MKSIRILQLSLLAALFFTISACSKEEPYSCASCIRNSEAQAANDNSSKGVYKGVLVGSSGTIRFDVQNNGTDINAVLIIDGITVQLTSAVTWVSGQPYLAPFTGTLNGQPVSITFSVLSNGSSPTITTNSIPGHPNAAIAVFKETSNSQVVCFEGTFSGQNNGTLNVMLSTGLGVWTVVTKNDVGGAINHFDGTVSNNVVNSLVGEPVVITGTLSGDQLINGTWDDGSLSGTWSADKTL